MDNSTSNSSGAPSAAFTPWDVFLPIWTRKWWILAGMLLCAAVAAGVSLVMPETFESKATLVLMPPPFKEQSDEMSGLIPKVLGVRDYEIMLRSDGLLVRVEEAIRGLGTWPEADLERLAKPSVLRGSLSVTTEVVQKTAYGTTYSPMIVLSANWGSGEQARDLAQAWAEVAEKAAATLYQKGKSGLKAFVDEQFGAASTELAAVQGQIRDLEMDWDQQQEEERLQATHTRLLDYEKEREAVALLIGMAQEEIAALTGRLEAEPETITLWKSPPMTAVFLQGDEQGP
ncbi:MAG: hypothetical protein JXR94_07610, partial [Candidatus Hydrogenedentes bacterium]|nr:hypothetical protein [Candidatus Hydrogenedentota bacterium]